MNNPLPQCDRCTHLGFQTNQKPWESALFLPSAGEWLCAHCRGSDRFFVPGRYTPNQSGYIQPGSPEWLACITPSKIAAILGASRWESPYRLWHRMKGILPPEEPKDIFDIGHDYEAAAANRWRRHNDGWRLSPREVQFVGIEAISGFPYICTLDRRGTRGRSKRVVEFKTARHMEEWGDDFTDDCPEDYAAQVISQMMFTGWTDHPGHLLVLGPYFNDHIYSISYDHGVAAWIRTECRKFFQSLKADTPPALDDSVATYECVRELHPDIDGTTVEVDANLGMAIHNINQQLKSTESELLGLKSQLLVAMGNAESAVIGDPTDPKKHLKVAKRSPHGSGSVSLNLARTHPAVQAANPKKKKEGTAA